MSIRQYGPEPSARIGWFKLTPPSIGGGVGVGFGVALSFATSSLPHAASVSASPVISHNRMRVSIASSCEPKTQRSSRFLQGNVLLLFQS